MTLEWKSVGKSLTSSGSGTVGANGVPSGGDKLPACRPCSGLRCRAPRPCAVLISRQPSCHSAAPILDPYRSSALQPSEPSGHQIAWRL